MTCVHYAWPPYFRSLWCISVRLCAIIRWFASTFVIVLIYDLILSFISPTWLLLQTRLKVELLSPNHSAIFPMWEYYTLHFSILDNHFFILQQALAYHFHRSNVLFHLVTHVVPRASLAWSLGDPGPGRIALPCEYILYLHSTGCISSGSWYLYIIYYWLPFLQSIYYIYVGISGRISFFILKCNSYNFCSYNI